ncbi:MAG: NADP-dependent malic enzyme [Aigarchaeota archaeon]|nr:NADP-dependent malic enzyme [Candidatus Geocrenenecus dongiae]
MTLKVPVRSYDDFAIWYTPGVAEPCKLIHKDPEQVFEHTNRGNTIAVISDGTRILGLGDIGPEAGLPVMEGKALLFKYLGGVDAIPLVLNVREADEIIKVVKALEPSFGGINLEDIEKPKCFYILETLRKQMNIPVWHDDQQGTATVTTAALINALKVVGKKINDVVIAMIGAGAANIAIARLMIAAGVDPGKIRMVDSRGILYAERDDVDKLQFSDPWKYEMAIKTNKDRVTGGIPESLKGADVVIAMSKPGPGVIKKEWVEQMADNAIVFACANPIPEIWPWEAKEAGARIVATGRSDFPNQVNNSLGFPGIFRGALDVRARTITDEMCLAAANELAKVAEEKGLSEDYIIPTMEDWEVYPREAAAVGMKAMEQGVARVKYSRDELLEMAYEKIRAAREMVKLLMKEGFILPPPE